jgi:hypothetical protein
VLRSCAADVHPPLHFLLVWAWRALVGECQTWQKLLSVALGLATLLALHGFARDAFGRRVALLAAALFAIHPMAVYFGQEVRGYALLWPALLSVTWLAWRWLERGRHRDGAAFVAAATVALYTHYIAGLVLAFGAAWGLVALRGDRRRLVVWIGLHAAIAALFAPQLPTFVAQMARAREHWAGPATPAELLDLARHLAFGASYLVPVVAALALAPLLHPRPRIAAAYLWWMSLGPILASWALSAGGVSPFIERYYFFTLAAWMALAAAGALGIVGLESQATTDAAGTAPESSTAVGPGRRALHAAVALLLLGFDARALMLHRPLPEAAAMKRVAEWLLPRLSPGDVVFCADTHSLLFLRHHYPDRVDAVLLMTRPRLPYYEADAFIPAAWRGTPDSLVRAAGAGGWGVRVRSGLAPGIEAERRLTEAAGSPVRMDDGVAVWRLGGSARK